MRTVHKRSLKDKLVKVTAWVPEKQLKHLMKASGSIKNQSGFMRLLIENELERIDALNAHKPLYAIASKGDFDDSLL